MLTCFFIIIVVFCCWANTHFLISYSNSVLSWYFDYETSSFLDISLATKNFPVVK